jgi:hypothetical protein
MIFALGEECPYGCLRTSTRDQESARNADAPVSLIATVIREPDRYGCTVSVADLVTPAPETEIVTTVGAVTAFCVKMRKLAPVIPAGIVTLVFV